MRLIAPTAGVAALVIVGTLYLCREPLSEVLARNWLRDHGVASGLRIRSISLSGLSAEVRLGNPADPDLTVERLEVGYALEGPWSGAPVSVQTRWVRLVRPRIKLRLVGSRLDFGGMQRLVDDLSKGAPGVGPQPDIQVEDGAIRLLTVAGEVDARADVTLKAGALTSARATVAPFSLASAQDRLNGQGGDLAVVRRGGGFSVTAASGPVSMSNGVDRVRVAGLRLTGMLPGLPEGRRWAGAVDLTLTANGAATAARGVNASDGRLTARLQGRVDAIEKRQTMTGGLDLSAELGSILGGGVGARNVAAGLRLPHLTVERRGAAISLIGDGEADLGVLALSGGGGEGALRTGPIRLTRLKLSSRGGPLAVSGVADGGLEEEGGLAPAQAARLARSIPVLAGQPAYLGATQRALRRFRLAAPRWRAAFDAGTARVTLLSPIRVDAVSAAHLSLSTPAGGVLIGPSRVEGAATLAVDGGGLPTLRVQVADAAVGPGRLQADVAARGALDLAAVHGARFDIRGRLAGAGAHYRFDLTADAPFSAERLAFDPNAITGLSGGLRRGGAPLFEIGPRGWTASGRLQGVQGDVAGFDAGVRAADASVQAHGGKGLDGLMLDLERAQVLDQAKPLRFMPLGFTGTVSLAGGALTGDLKAATRAGRPIGVIHLRHDLASATGRADIDAGGLAFSPHALQPAELSPLAAFAKDADGAASFRGWFGWAPGKPPASGGVLTAKGLKFTSPVGPVLGIDADLRFTSLAPLVSAPDQVMTVQLVKAVTPLSGVSTQFDFTDKAVSIDAAAGDGRAGPHPAGAYGGAPHARRSGEGGAGAGSCEHRRHHRRLNLGGHR